MPRVSAWEATQANTGCNKQHPTHFARLLYPWNVAATTTREPGQSAPVRNHPRASQACLSISLLAASVERYAGFTFFPQWGRRSRSASKQAPTVASSDIGRNFQQRGEIAPVLRQSFAGP